MSDGLINSLALVTIIAEIEEQLGVEFGLDELDVNQCQSVDRIVESLAKMTPAMI